MRTWGGGWHRGCILAICNGIAAIINNLKGAESGGVGAEGAPTLRKYDVINIHIHLNERKIKKQKEKFFTKGQECTKFRCFNCGYKQIESNNKTWRNASFVRLAPASQDVPFVRLPPPTFKRFQHPWITCNCPFSCRAWQSFGERNDEYI